MAQLEMKALKDQVNLKLLNDIISYTVQAAGANIQQKRELERRCIFPNQTGYAGLFQEEYGFLYLGELLERYEERFGMTIQDQRAIALALGYTRDLATDEMFVGSQRTDFIQAVRRSADGDPYLTGALYLLHEGEQDGLAYGSWLKERQYTQTEELIFVMSLFYDIEQTFPHFKAQLIRLLGTERTIPVFENTDIFRWIAAALFPFKKLIRGKDTSLFRALLALPASFVKEGSKPYACLREHGYTPLEIAYANAMAVYGRWVYEGVRNKTLLAEKIVVALFSVVLDSEDTLPAAAYDQLANVYSLYEIFDVKYCEVRKLSDALNGARIKCPETMAWFIRHTSPLHPAASSFDIMDARWDSLAASLKPKVYRQLFEATLTKEMDAGALRQRIGRYDELTQKSYMDFYWNSQDGNCFSLLVDAGVIDLWTAFQTSIGPDGDAVKSGMLHHIGEYIRNIQTMQAFQFFKKFMPQYGYDGLKTYFSGFSQGFDHRLWKGDGYQSKKIILMLERDYLKDDPASQLLMLHWIEDYFFFLEPEKYLSFVQAVLEDEAAAGLLPAAEQRRLFDLFTTQKDVPTYVTDRLKKRYLTPEELQADQAAAEAAMLEGKRQQHNRLVQSIKRQYTDSTGATFRSVWNFMYDYRYQTEKELIAAQTIREGLAERVQNANGSLTRKDALYFLNICARLIDLSVMGWAEAQSYILNIKEVADDDPSGDPTG